MKSGNRAECSPGRQTSVLVLGGTSDIGRAVAEHFAATGYSVQLAARDPHRLIGFQAELSGRYGVAVELYPFDATATHSHAEFVKDLAYLPEVVVCAVGALGDQRNAEQDPSLAGVIMRTNLEGPASVLAMIANCMEARGSGTIVGISSVAGERGRASNYVYGAAKAGFTAFLSGLRNRLARRGVHVVTVLPGFVATRMTAGMALPGLLTAQPQQVAAAIERAVSRRQNVVYVGAVWRVVMLIVRLIPEQIFKRLRL
jgi:short-subunit dehydrogenase